MVYVARTTKTPHADARRKWVGWMGTAAGSPGRAIENYLGEQSEDYFDMDNYWQKWQRARGIPPQERTDWDYDTNMPESFLVWLGAERGIEARKLPGADKWVIVDHEGMAVFRLDAKTPKAAIEEANELYHHRPRFDAESTIGNVRYIGPALGNWHVFWADGVETEAAARYHTRIQVRRRPGAVVRKPVRRPGQVKPKAPAKPRTRKIVRARKR